MIELRYLIRCSLEETRHCRRTLPLAGHRTLVSQIYVMIFFFKFVCGFENVLYMKEEWWPVYSVQLPT